MKFTADEMNHPSAWLSGGQKAKLMFLMMAESGARVAMIGRNAEKIRAISPRFPVPSFANCLRNIPAASSLSPMIGV